MNQLAHPGQMAFHSRLLLGAQSNGLTAISDILVNLRSDLYGFYHFHLARGQIISFPVTEDHYIQASSYVEPALTSDIQSEYGKTLLHRFDDSHSDLALRVDIEPCWGDNPRTVLFVIRSQGVPVATLNIVTCFWGIATLPASCRCSTPSWEVSVDVEDRWQLVGLSQLMRRRLKGTSSQRTDLNLQDTRVLVDASSSVEATIYAISTLYCQNQRIAQDCLRCAYESVKGRYHVSNNRACLMIAHVGKSNPRFVQITEPPPCSPW